MVLNHGSLFSGGGGFDLPSDLMGWNNVFHCEINPFCRTILKYYWTNSISYHDITKTDFSIHRGKIDILTGGFPCQPYSTAGARKGKDDERHLWPENLRAIREIKPSWIVGENVRGIINWNEGLVFKEVQTDLENEGYEVWPFLLPACSVGAPHQRYRTWFVSRLITDSSGQRFSWYKEFKKRFECESIRFSFNELDAFYDNWITTNANGQRQQRQRRTFEQVHTESNRKREASWSEHDDRWPTQSPIRGRNDGIPSQLDGTSILENGDTITGKEWQEESIKMYGNAVVPQLVMQIFKTIEKMETIIQLLKS